MEKNKTIAMVITAAVAIIMVGSLLVPIINDAVDDTKVYYNNAFGSYAQVAEDETIDIDITTTTGTAGSTVYSVNGESVGVPQGARAILMAENVAIYQNYADGLVCYGVTSDGNLTTFVNYAVLDVSIEGDTITIVATTSGGTSTTFNFNCEWIFYRSNTGDYRLVDYINTKQTVYVNDLNQVYGANRIGTTSEFFSFNGTNVKIATLTSDTTTIRETTATVSTTDVMKDVISFEVDPSRATSSSFKFITDNNGEDYEVFPYYFVVPASVYGQTETNAAYAGVLAVLPILVICGIMVAVVATFRSKF